MLVGQLELLPGTWMATTPSKSPFRRRDETDYLPQDQRPRVATRANYQHMQFVHLQHSFRLDTEAADEIIAVHTREYLLKLWRIASGKMGCNLVVHTEAFI